MVMTRLLFVIALVACKPSAAPRALLDDPGCVCVCTEAGPPAPSDGALDASPDAAIALDLVTPWTRTVVTAATTGIYRGADGTAIDSEGCYVTAWEEGGISTRACFVSGAWVTELLATGISGPEDAKAADLDGDGVIDVVTTADNGQRVYITFRGAPNVTTTLTASMGHGHAMQAAISDVNGDGLPDVIFGTRGGSPAVVAWLENPGALARTGSAWVYHQISEAGWVMSLVVVGGRLVVSDRGYRLGTGGAHLWDLYGARWLELVGGAWVNHPISAPAGACPVGQPMCTTKTPGDEMFLAVDGDTVYDCQSHDTATDSRIMVHHTTDWLTWTHAVVPPMANVGHCQGVIPADVDHDGLTDLIVTNWKGNAFPVPPADTGKSGVYLLHRTATGWERGEISGPIGGKFDNAVMRGSCVLTSEQLDPAGGLGVVLYCPPWG